MNVYDSDRMSDVLAPLGYAPTDAAEDADMVILNTCHIREKASEKVFSELGRLRQLKERARDQQGRQMTIAVAGCVAQAEGAEITRRAPWVDIVVGPQTYHRLPELISQIDPMARNCLIDTDFPEEVKFDFLPGEHVLRGPAAFLSVQEGCDKFCAFCVVPYTRGAEFSRPVATIIEEARRVVAGGTRELTLLGQNVNAFHGEAMDGKSWTLGRLIRELADIEGLDRLRYTTSHPLDMDDELITAHGDVPQLMPYLHLPIQSGSNHILAAMNRRHTCDVYLRVIDKLRAVRPDIALSGDFIVGFPGETDGDFAQTLQLVSQVGYASAYSFKYSPRPGTPAATSENQIAEEVLGCIELVQIIFDKLGMTDYRVRVGLRDPDSTKYVGDPKRWDKAEKACRDAAASLGVDWSEEEGEAAFYGPKIDFVVKDVIGREWQLGTVQVDYNLPERFDLTYKGSDGELHRPVMIHRAPFGSMERFCGVLIEHFAGRFPTWLSPTQCHILTISEKHTEYASKVANKLKENGIRVEIDDGDGTIGKKIRTHRKLHPAYMVILGDGEAEGNTVSLRARSGEQVSDIPLDDFITNIVSEINNKSSQPNLV